MNMRFLHILIPLFGVINDVVGERSIAEVDALLKTVEQVGWREDEKPCLDAVVAMLNGVRNSTLWATWMWDANQRPTGALYGLQYHLGNFDECLNPPWLNEHPELRPQYCLLDFQLSQKKLHKYRRYFGPYETATTYINTISARGRYMNTVSWGLCLPSQCSAQSVATVGLQMARTSHLMAMTDDPAVTVNYCNLAGETKSYGFGARVFFALIIFLLLVAIASTYVKPTNTLGAMIVKSFCIKTNFAELIDVKAKEISVLNGIRCLSFFLLVWCHMYMFAVGSAVINALDIDKDASESLLGVFLHHVDIFVDTFFALSGLLHVNSLLAAKPDRPQNLVKLICKRYVRLLGALVVAMAFMTFVFGDMDNGPLWQKFAVKEQGICVKTWWRCMLMLTTSAKEMCYVVTWYLCCDFQLTIVSIIIFNIYRKNKRNGIQLYGIFSLLSVLITGLITYSYRLRPNVFTSLRHVIDLRSSKHLDYLYLQTYYRGGPYAVGVAMAYILFKYQPDDHKKILSKIWSFLGMVFSLIVMVCVISLGYIFYDREYNVLEASIVSALDRVVWACAVCSVVGICIYGDLPLINDFLCWSFFRPLSRLSYGVYMFHAMVLQKYTIATRAPFRYDHFSFMLIACGVFSVSCAASLFTWLVVEAPLNNMFNTLLNVKALQKNSEKPVNKGFENVHKKLA